MSRTCPLCLELRSEDTIYHIKKCDCPICWQCMTSYVELMVHEGRVIQMACPVNKCRNSFLTSNEIKNFLSERRYARYLELKFLKEIELDPRLTFCPRPGCETVCQIEDDSGGSAGKHRRKRTPIRSGSANKSKSTSSATRADQVRSVDSMMPLPAAAWRTRRLVKALTCPKCALTFCNACKIEWHPNESCEVANARRRPEERSVFYLFSSTDKNLKQNTTESQPGPSSSAPASHLTVTYKKDDSSREISTTATSLSATDDKSANASPDSSTDYGPTTRSKLNDQSAGGNVTSNGETNAETEAEPTVKPCPVCAMPIERDAGCAQMLCERCRHLFCWYCLKLLDNDYFLRHYDSGPCRAKLGHSRSAVHWHRVQVAAMFAGIGLLALLASPFLILAAPCIICCRPGAVTSFTRKLTGQRRDDRDEPELEPEMDGEQDKHTDNENESDKSNVDESNVNTETEAEDAARSNGKSTEQHSQMDASPVATSKVEETASLNTQDGEQRDSSSGSSSSAVTSPN